MAIRERLIYAIDVVTDGAQKGLKNFRTSVSEAQGTVGKFKAGASSAFDTVAANAGTLAIGAGAALVGFGIKAVDAFTDVGKAAVDMSAATGLSIEDSSRWIAVADDMEVSAEQLTTGLGKIAKTLDEAKWDKYGIATRDASGKARDANDILLDTFDMLGRISNETERARVGNELFGKGYANIAPLVGKTRGEYEKYLGAVEAGQVVTAEEAAKAEKTRLAIDRLKDSIQEITLAVGEGLAPVVEDVADGLSDMTDGAMRLKSALEKIPGVPKGVQLWWDFASPLGWQRNLVRAGDAVTGFGKKLLGIGGDSKSAADTNRELSESYESVASSAGLAKGAAATGAKEAGDAVAEYGDRLTQFHEKVDLATAAIEMKADADAAAADADEKAAEMADRHAEAVEAVADAMREQFDAALELVGGDIAVRNAQRDAADAVEELNGVLDDQETTLGQAGAAIDDAADAQLNAAHAAADYRAKQMEANGQTVDGKVQAQLFKEELQNLVGQLDGPLAAALQKYIDDLDALDGRTVRTSITLTTPGRVGDIVGTQGRLSGGIQRFASGGVVGGTTGQPQLAIVEGGETVVPTHKSGVGMGGVYNVTLNVTQALSPDEVVQLVKKYERFNGQRWRA